MLLLTLKMASVRNAKRRRRRRLAFAIDWLGECRVLLCVSNKDVRAREKEEGEHERTVWAAMTAATTKTRARRTLVNIFQRWVF